MASNVKIWPPSYGTGYGVSADNVRVWPSGEYCGGGLPGTSGYSGYSGVSGASGASGYSGTSGKSGYSGTSGVSGYSGASPSVLLEIDYMPTPSPLIDFDINSDGTIMAVSTAAGTVQFTYTSNMIAIATTSVTTPGYIRYCPNVDEFWCLKTTGDTIYRFSGTTGALLGTVSITNSFCLHFDTDDDYVYIGYYDSIGGTAGIVKIQQSDPTSITYNALAGNGDRRICTFYRGGAWHLYVVSTYGIAIYDTSISLECNLSAIANSYEHRYIDVSPDGNTVALMTAYSPDKLQLIDITDFGSPSLLYSHDRPYSGTAMLDNDKFIWSTQNDANGFNGRLLISDFAMTNTKCVSGSVVHYNATYYPIPLKYGGYYYFLFSSGSSTYASSIRKYVMNS